MKPPIELLHTSWFANIPRLEARSLTGRNGSPRIVIGGTACVFGAPSSPRLGFVEYVERSCFKKSEGDGWPLVRALFEHQPGVVLGAVHAGTMRIMQDNHSMTYEVDMPETRSAEYESIQRGDVNASSPAFAVYQDEWRRGSGGFPERHLVSAQLDHIAPTSMPAYPDATVSLRSLAAEKEATLDEVVQDALSGNLDRYFVNHANIDKRASDMEHQHVDGQLDLYSRRNALRAGQYGLDGGADSLLSIYRRRNQCRATQWDAPEAHSNPWVPVT